MHRTPPSQAGRAHPAPVPQSHDAREAAAGCSGSRSALDAALCAAHATGDTRALTALYTQAADQAARTSQAEAFYLTHAMVFALEAGDARADALRARLVALGREAPL